jgi:protein subunit release factor A
MKKKSNIETALEALIQQKKKELELLVKGIQKFREQKEYLYKAYMLFLSPIKDNRERQIIAISMIEAGGDKGAIITAIELLAMGGNKN